MGEIIPEDILEFASSSRYEPVLGFKLKPIIILQLPSTVAAYSVNVC